MVSKQQLSLTGILTLGNVETSRKQGTHITVLRLINFVDETLNYNKQNDQVRARKLHRPQFIRCLSNRDV